MAYQIQQPVLALLSEGPIETDYGKFRISVFHDGHDQAVVLSIGELTGQENVLCRIHSECISSHVFFAHTCDCRQQMIESQKLLAETGQGLIIYLQQEGRGGGAAAHVATLTLKEQGVSQPKAYEMVGFPKDTREFDIVSKVFYYYQIKSVVLLSSNKKKKQAFVDWGIKISDMQYPGPFIDLKGAKSLRQYIAEGKEHIPIVDRSIERKWIFVVGDLNVDYLLSETNLLGQNVKNSPPPVVGGTGFNAARTFKYKGFEPIIFGKIGNDREGQLIRQELEKVKFRSLVQVSENKNTGRCHLYFDESKQERLLIKEEHNANDYDLNRLKQALVHSGIGEKDHIFIVGHFLVRHNRDDARELMSLLSKTKARIILDVVPHTMHREMKLSDFNYAVGDNAHVIIGEYPTLMGLIEPKVEKDTPDNEDWVAMLKTFRSQFLVVRYGKGNISRQTICTRVGDSGFQILEDEDTGYLYATSEEKRGFGDGLTADFLIKYQEAIFEKRR
jgi:3,4-dihydroxy 2-butanone 4-phosphate synthase/GTP cyclohydrolase II